MDMDYKKEIIIENEQLRLILDSNCIARSLICKSSGEECLANGKNMSLFSVTQERPYNNENKLIYMNKRTTYQANRVRREENRLIVGFETAPYEAIVEITEAPMYIGFTLIDFIVHPTDYPDLAMSVPPVAEFRFLQLPVRDREHFGEWLNVCWDNQTGINVLSTSPDARIGAEKRDGYRIFSADAVRDIKLQGCGAALIVSAVDQLLDCVAAAERDYGLPEGVESRRNPLINASIYWTGSINPSNADEHILYAGKGGFRLMLIYYSAIFKEGKGYSLCGNYDYKDEYPSGAEDLKKMLQKLKVAGITPGIHFLHTHIGVESRYITPFADHRLNLSRQFMLSKPVSEDDTVIYVEQNPCKAVMADGCRILKFEGELISYESYSAVKPYCFTGCSRGYLNTAAQTHGRGTMGGILDVSEFGATSVYLDQNTDLQEEIADKIAEAYNCGFEFVYFDGSEGTNAPFDFHIPNAQYRVYRKFRNAPIFCEGAAKAHFGWHMLSGGNAFDVFPTDVFKEKIREFPMKDAEHMQNDFTRVNFGWWAFRNDTQPDIYEYGMSRAAAWDCSATIMENVKVFHSNPRTDDVLEVVRRWEEVRERKWLTEEQKSMLRKGTQEHALLINEQGEYELVPYEAVAGAARDSGDLQAFYFARGDRNYVVCWHKKGSGMLKVRIDPEQIVYQKELGGDKVPCAVSDGYVIIPVSGRHYISSALPKEKLLEAIRDAEMIE